MRSLLFFSGLWTSSTNYSPNLEFVCILEIKSTREVSGLPIL